MVKKKTKIYLDTSVISYLDQQDTPEQMRTNTTILGNIKNWKI